MKPKLYLNVNALTHFCGCSTLNISENDVLLFAYTQARRNVHSGCQILKLYRLLKSSEPGVGVTAQRQ